MGDFPCPSDDKFHQVLQDSLRTWSSYMTATSDDELLLPREAVDLKPLACQTPPFLGYGHASVNEKVSFACEQRKNGDLLVHGESTWTTTKGDCDLPPRVLAKQLLLAVGSRIRVRLSGDSPLSEWLGVQGLSSYDKGNYLSLLYLAWAYILSARWVELLSRCADHESRLEYIAREIKNPSLQSDELSTVQVDVDIGDDASEDEVHWWRALLWRENSWDASTQYNGRVHLSPWSVSVQDTGFEVSLRSMTFSDAKSSPPSSTTALNYLSRFCVRHRLYAQCSVALAGVLLSPLLGGTISLPYPRGAPRPEQIPTGAWEASVHIPSLLDEHDQLLPKYMTLSCNPWGLRSLLASTFFNPDIECNLVSAWLNPAFAILKSISAREHLLAAFLANREPRLGILWLGAILTGLAESVLRDVRNGMTALDLSASAWTGIAQTFLTSAMGTIDSQWINRDDECRLLFITAAEGHDRPPIWTWKPFGRTKMGDTELPVRQHAMCAAHCLEYESWGWKLSNGCFIQVFGDANCRALAKTTNRVSHGAPVNLDDCHSDLLSQSLSEVFTRGVFSWLRSTGYPPSERPIYQHSWFDLEDTDDEEEPDDSESDMETQWSSRKLRVDGWLDNIT